MPPTTLEGIKRAWKKRAKVSYEIEGRVARRLERWYRGELGAKQPILALLTNLKEEKVGRVFWSEVVLPSQVKFTPGTLWRGMYLDDPSVIKQVLSHRDKKEIEIQANKLEAWSLLDVVAKQFAQDITSRREKCGVGVVIKHDFEKEDVVIDWRAPIPSIYSYKYQYETVIYNHERRMVYKLPTADILIMWCGESGTKEKSLSSLTDADVSEMMKNEPHWKAVTSIRRVIDEPLDFATLRRAFGKVKI